MLDYHTTHGGQFLTITETETGDTCFLQGDEAAELDDQLEACQTQEQIDRILGAYAECLEAAPETDDE